MGREVKRVPLDFSAPLNEVWTGFLRPDELDLPECRDCDGQGSTVAARWVGCIAHLLLMVGEAGVSDRPLHPWLHQIPLNPGVKPGPDAAELSGGLAGRAPRMPFGHDAIDRWSATEAIVRAAGLPETWGRCPACGGEGSTGTPEQKAAHEAWKPAEPPTGDGWQLWETVSEGSPISPVFETAEELARWMTENRCTVNGPMSSYETALRFVQAGWAPSFMASAGTGLVTGAEWVGQERDGAR